jgi:hypothetical protein
MHGTLTGGLSQRAVIGRTTGRTQYRRFSFCRERHPQI